MNNTNQSILHKMQFLLSSHGPNNMTDLPKVHKRMQFYRFLQAFIEFKASLQWARMWISQHSVMKAISLDQ